MWIAWLGAAITGLMWGWLAATRIGSSNRPWLNALSLIGATLLLCAAIAWKVDRQTVLPFLGAGVLACCVHFEWRRLLRMRFGSRVENR